MLDTTTKPFAQTHSGRVFPLIDPKPEDVHWDDIAWALAHTNRYAGNAGTYSVAQHSIIVAYALPPDLRLHGLLHDAAEFVVGDMTRPVKLALRWINPAALRTHEEVYRGVERVIFLTAGLPYPISRDIRLAVKHADNRAAMAEKRDLLAPMPVTDEAWLHGGSPPPPLPQTIRPWNAATAYLLFKGELEKHGIG